MRLVEIPPLPVTHFRDGLSPEQKAIALEADLIADDEWILTARALLLACANEAKPTEVTK